MGHVLVFEHHPHETAGLIADALALRQINHKYVQVHLQQPIPQTIDELSGIVLMGGPMSVYEQEKHPFLIEEIALVKKALEKNIPILGICLGSQILASALGSKVYPGDSKEIGWHAIHLSSAGKDDFLWKGLPESFIALNWHGDVFDTPPDSICLASSDKTACQAFQHGGKAYGLLFHLEVTEPMVYDMVHQFSDDIQQAHESGHRILAAARSNIPDLEDLGKEVFSRWASLIDGNSE
jgi:GMP synthase-like glutamine amidotransferase